MKGCKKNSPEIIANRFSVACENTLTQDVGACEYYSCHKLMPIKPLSYTTLSSISSHLLKLFLSKKRHEVYFCFILAAAVPGPPGPPGEPGLPGTRNLVREENLSLPFSEHESIPRMSMETLH